MDQEPKDWLSDLEGEWSVLVVVGKMCGDSTTWECGALNYWKIVATWMALFDLLPDWLTAQPKTTSDLLKLQIITKKEKDDTYLTHTAFRQQRTETNRKNKVWKKTPQNVEV